VTVNRRGLGTSVVRLRILAAAFVLLAAAFLVLNSGSRSPKMAAKSVASGYNTQAAAGGFLSASLSDTSFSSTSAPSASSPVHARASAGSLLAHLPLIFEPNQGQANLDPSDPHARFLAHGSGYALMLGSEGASITVRSQRGTLDSVRMKLAGADPHATLHATNPLPGQSNYLLGNDSSKWRSNVAQYARVRYENVYPGISLVFYGNQGHLEYDFQVAPGAEPSQAELEFDGASSVELRDGALQIKRGDSVVRLEAPRVYQQVGGQEQPVDGRFVLRNAHRAGFAIGSYDRSRELIIDPVLSFSTYFGGAGDEAATSVAVDTSGNIYLTGSTDSANLPFTPGVFQTTLNTTPPNTNVYIAKINPVVNPPVLVYMTYLGGSGSDTPAGIAVDGAGDAYVAGTTSSLNFPHSPTAYQIAPESGTTGTQHVFVTELNPTATAPLLYSSYLSGNGTDLASGMTIDSAGNLYVTGTTTSTDNSSNNPTAQFPASTLPNQVPFQPQSPGTIQFFVTKVDTSNSGNASILYSTYFGGDITVSNVAPIATGGGIAVDNVGNVYFDGTTNYTYTNGEAGDFPILNAYQPCLDQAPPASPTNPPVCANAATATFTDAFAAKLNLNLNIPQGEQLQWSTYFGGTQTDTGAGIAVDNGAEHVFIVGTTNSPGITGTSNFAPFQICLDTPVNPAPGAACNLTVTASDAYVASLSNPALAGTAVNMVLNYFSYLGGSGNDQGLAITVDSTDNAYLTGSTESTDFDIFPANNDGLQSNLAGFQDAFIARLNTTTTNGQNTTGAFSSYFGGATPISGTSAMTQGTGIALDANANVYFAGDTNTTNLQVNSLQTTNAGGFDAFVTELKTVSTITITGVLTLGTNQLYIAAGNPATFTYTVTNGGPDPAYNLNFTDNLGNAGVTLTFISASSTNGTCSGGGTSLAVTCSIPTLEPGSTATITVVVTPTPTGTTANFNGGTAQVSGPNVLNPPQITVSAKMSDFSLVVNPPNQSVNVAGDTAPYQVKLTPNPVYGTNIALSCTGLPPGTACTFAPTNSVTLPNTSPGAVTLNITTTARPINTGSVKIFRSFLAVWLVAPGLALFTLGTNRRRRRLLGFLMLCALFIQLLLLPACSGTNTQVPGSGTPAGTYPITVTAASGTDSKSIGIELTVP
jgi:uncharacterized protein DUF11/beta-propeller repeat-containing protein